MINRFLAAFTRTRLNRFMLLVKEESWEEFRHVHRCDHGEQDDFVAVFRTTSKKKSTFENGKNSAISPKTKTAIPVHVADGIFRMSTYNSRRAMYLGKGEKQRLVGKDRSSVFSRRVERKLQTLS